MTKKELQTGEDKIQQICDLLRFETLEPAKSEAAQVIEDAMRQANQIVESADQEAKEHLKRAHEQIENDRAVFQSALQQAASQCLETLKQKIQSKLFNAELESTIRKAAANPKVVAELIEAIVKALEKEGSAADLEALIPQAISAEEVNRLLAGDILRQLQGGSVSLGSFAAGAQVKLLDQQLTLDISDAVLKDLLARYLRKDFRELIFQA